MGSPKALSDGRVFLREEVRGYLTLEVWVVERASVRVCVGASGEKTRGGGRG